MFNYFYMLKYLYTCTKWVVENIKKKIKSVYLVIKLNYIKYLPVSCKLKYLQCSSLFFKFNNTSIQIPILGIFKYI